MAFSRNTEELAAQAETFRLLSYLFDSPDSSLVSTIADVKRLYREDVHATELLDGMAESLECDDTVALQVDHAKLFIGPFEMLAPPYASLYLETGDQVCGKTTASIERCYRNQGFELTSKEKQPADYIGYLFEFIYLLAFRYLQGTSEVALEDIDRFADKYVLNWMPRFFSNIDQGAETRYFKCLAKLGLEHLPVETR